MTFLEPKKERKTLDFIYLAMGLGIIIGIFFLVVMYNQVVSLKHDISGINNEIEREQAKVAEIKEAVFSILNSDEVKIFIAEKGLISEKSPSYFESTSQESIILSANFR